MTGLYVTKKMPSWIQVSSFKLWRSSLVQLAQVCCPPELKHMFEHILEGANSKKLKPMGASRL